MYMYVYRYELKFAHEVYFIQEESDIRRYLDMYVYLFVYVCIFCIYICLSIYLFVYLFVYIYVYIYKNMNLNLLMKFISSKMNQIYEGIFVYT
jgi:hypothetical protein